MNTFFSPITLAPVPASLEVTSFGRGERCANGNHATPVDVVTGLEYAQAVLNIWNAMEPTDYEGPGSWVIAPVTEEHMAGKHLVTVDVNHVNLKGEVMLYASSFEFARAECGRLVIFNSAGFRVAPTWAKA